MVVSVLESVMLICFGISWPFSLAKDIRAKTAKGKSTVFLIAILVGYLAGIAGKICGHYLYDTKITYVLALYIINVCVVTADLVVTVINKKRDALETRGGAVNV